MSSPSSINSQSAHCHVFISMATGLEQLWATTCVGSAARLWIFGHKSEFLIPFVPSEGLPEKSQYISTHGRETFSTLSSTLKGIRFGCILLPLL